MKTSKRFFSRNGFVSSTGNSQTNGSNSQTANSNTTGSSNNVLTVYVTIPEDLPNVDPKRNTLNKINETKVSAVIYFNNGKKAMAGLLKNGRQHKKWTYWYDNGSMHSEGYFKNGKAVGVWTYYYDNGSKLSTINIIDNMAMAIRI